MMQPAPRKGGRRRFFRPRRKVCKFTTGELSLDFDYRDARIFRLFVTEHGKIIPRRISGNCAKAQRKLAKAVKRARKLSLVPCSDAHKV